MSARLPEGLAWQAVRDPYDRRRVVYWRIMHGSTSLASVRCEGEVWRALGYGKSTPSDNAALGTFPTRAKAEGAAVRYARAVADIEDRGDWTPLPCGCPRQVVADCGHQEGCREVPA